MIELMDDGTQQLRQIRKAMDGRDFHAKLTGAVRSTR